MSMFEKFRAAKAALVEPKLDRYQKAVRRDDAKEIALAADAAGIPAEQVEKDLADLERFRGMVGGVADVPATKAQLAKVNAEIESLEKELQSHRERISAKIAPLQERVEQLVYNVKNGESSVGQLSNLFVELSQRGLASLAEAPEHLRARLAESVSSAQAIADASPADSQQPQHGILGYLSSHSF